MKNLKKILLILLGLASTIIYSQEFEGNSIIVSIKKKKPSINWYNHLTNDTTVKSLTSSIIATVQCEDSLQKVELYVNESVHSDFELAKSGKNYFVKIDRTYPLVEGKNTIYIKASTAKESIISDTKIIIAQKPAAKPVITWISPSKNENTQDSAIMEIVACIKSNIPVKNVELYVNNNLMRGLSVVESADEDCAVMINKKISLKPDLNNIYIKASNEGGTATSETIYISYTTEMSKQRRVALIIGNSDYKNAGTLKNPKNDATDMAAALKRLNFDLELVSDADFKQLGMAIDRFGSRVKDADIAFFYYAGHGVQVKGNNYLIPIDADIKDENQVKYVCIDANQVLAYMESAESKVNIIVMDACRDNPFERSWKRSTKGQGLASMEAPMGSIVAYATQPGNTAADGTGKNGLYTSALLQYIEQPNLTLHEIFMKVRVKVLNESGKQQQPWESSSLTQNVYLLK